MKYIISQPNRTARLGHQFQNMSVAMALSVKVNDLDYVHTQFSGPSLKWENVLNFTKIFKTIKDIKPKKTIMLPNIDFGVDVGFPVQKAKQNIDYIINIINSEPEETLFVLSNDTFPGILSEEIVNISPELKNCYWVNKVTHDFNHKGTTIGIHIRRGDINETVQAARWLNVDDYLKIMDIIRKNNIYDSPHFYIFSESKPPDFKNLESDDVSFVLGGSDIETFHQMVSTDVLLSGLSTFPILAAYINKGETIYWELRNYNRWGGLDGFTNVKEILKDEENSIPM